MFNDGDLIKISNLGNLRFSKKIMDYLNINEDTILQVEYDTGKIILSKAYSKCTQCGSPDGILPFGGKEKKICEKCMKNFLNSLANRVDYERTDYIRNESEESDEEIGTSDNS